MTEPTVPLRGKLEKHPLATVLQALLRENRDGCLTVVRGTITRRLFLRGGMITYGSSTERQDRLGEILIAQGKLSKADHKKFWEQSQAGNRLLGITLVVNGRITLNDLYQGVTAQVVTILDRLQKWRSGDYEFEQGREPDPGTVLLRIPLVLYLRTDAEKKPARKAPARKKGRAAAAATAAVPDGAPEEQVVEITEEGPDPVAPISPEAAREIECVGEVFFMVQELRKRLGQDPYSLLGVPQNAERAVVQAAYHRIAMVLHPDRLPKSCAPELVQESEEILREATAASQAILNTAPPASAAAAARGRPAPGEEEQARRYFAQGREWIGKRNYWQAADALRQAVRLKPDEATYRQFLGLSLMQTKRLHEAEEHLVEATRLDPANATHFVNLGRIYRSGRLYRKAREAFERAMRVDPRNDQAREELSDLPEEPPARKSEGGSLLKKIFGKG